MADPPGIWFLTRRVSLRYSGSRQRVNAAPTLTTVRELPRPMADQLSLFELEPTTPVARAKVRDVRRTGTVQPRFELELPIKENIKPKRRGKERYHQRETRYCANQTCKKDISHKDKSAIYCSTTCRELMPHVKEKSLSRRQYNWKNYSRYRRHGFKQSELPPIPDKCENPFCNSSNLVIDHNHVTGKFRGYICHHCNTALGLGHENPMILRWLADYLEQRGGAMGVGSGVDAIQLPQPLAALSPPPIAPVVGGLDGGKLVSEPGEPQEL